MCRQDRMGQRDQDGPNGPCRPCRVGSEKDDGVKGDEMEEARTRPHPCSVESRR